MFVAVIAMLSLGKAPEPEIGTTKANPLTAITMIPNIIEIRNILTDLARFLLTIFLLVHSPDKFVGHSVWAMSTTC